MVGAAEAGVPAPGAPGAKRVVVRVVPVRGNRALAWALGLAFGLLTLGVLTYVVRLDHLLGISKYTGLGVAMTGWSLATLLGLVPPRPFVARAQIEGQRVTLEGGRPRELENVRGVRVARAKVGFSVAIAGDSDLFLEVEREADARRIAAVIGGEPRAACRFETLTRLGWLLQLGAGVPALAGALGYAVLVGLVGLSGLKEPFGLTAIIMGVVSTLVFVARPLLVKERGVEQPGAFAVGAARRHLLLHAAPVVGEGRAAATRLERGEEPARDWLTRIDRMAEGGGYRAEAPPANEQLVAVASDETAVPDARLAALRLLAKQGTIPEPVRLRVAEDLGIARVRIATSRSAEDAALALDAMGPAFRARA